MIASTPLVDLTRQSLVIHGPWSAVSAHIRCALTVRLLTERYTCRQTTDLQLKDAYFFDPPKEKKKRDADGERGEGAHRKSVRLTQFELVDPETWDLVIIRLGMLTAPNVIMPAILREALVTREKGATWLVTTPRAPLAEGHRAWSKDVEEYIDERYGRVEIGVEDDGNTEA